MEDEARPLPPGWIRDFDAKAQHQFFVDTTSDPPRSVWHHPYDDEAYLESLSNAERAKIQGLHRVPSEADIAAESSDEDDDYDHHAHHAAQEKGQAQSQGTGQTRTQPQTQSQTKQLPQRPEQVGGMTKFGRKMKDKMTGSSHEERDRERLNRAKAEQAAYERHQMLRSAMAKAIQTGEPQLVGKDKSGKDLYIEPPNGASLPRGGNGYSPYNDGPYTRTLGNSRYVRPSYPYSRPYGGGYGGGYGLPLLGGLGGGLLLGEMMGGGMGYGGMGMGGMGGMGMGGMGGGFGGGMGGMGMGGMGGGFGGDMGGGGMGGGGFC